MVAGPPTRSPGGDGAGAEKCEVPAASASPPNVPLVWADVPDKAWIRFKSDGYTYEQPRTNARMVEEVDQGVAHRVASGTKIAMGTHGGEVAWFRYQRDVGSARPRYVVAKDVELR
jgi:hypothetical protein